MVRFTTTDPSFTFSNPAMVRNVVVFPHPDGPSKQMISPFSAVNEILWMAGLPDSYAQETLFSSKTIETLLDMQSVIENR